MHHPKIPQWYQVLKFENNFHVCMCDANIQNLYMYNSMEVNEGKCDMHQTGSPTSTMKQIQLIGINPFLAGHPASSFEEPPTRG